LEQYYFLSSNVFVLITTERVNPRPTSKKEKNKTKKQKKNAMSSGPFGRWESNPGLRYNRNKKEIVGGCAPCTTSNYLLALGVGLVGWIST
jgi:hypothetical protein